MDYTDYVLHLLNHLGISVMIPIGGDDTLSFGVRLHKEGFPVVAIPKTMDNDVFGTDYCIGFSTAVTRSVEFITNMRTTAGSHERIAVMELFGRNSGETSLISAYLSYVDRAIISEVPFEIHKLVEFLVEDKRNNPSNYAIMTISEGAIMQGGEVIESGEADMFGHRKLGGVGVLVAEEIKRISGQDIIYQQLSYLMRSGAPDSLDRMVAMSYGNLAVQLIRRNETGKMVALHGGKYTTVPVDMVLAGKKRVDVPSYYDIEALPAENSRFHGCTHVLKLNQIGEMNSWKINFIKNLKPCSSGSVEITENQVKVKDAVKLRKNAHKLAEASALGTGSKQGFARYLTRHDWA